MSDFFTQRFSLDISGICRHREYSEDDPKWIIKGDLASSIRDYWAKGSTQQFRWGFYIVVGKKDGKFVPVKFENRDPMGTYSHFFRALVWRRLKTTVFLGLR